MAFATRRAYDLADATCHPETRPTRSVMQSVAEKKPVRYLCLCSYSVCFAILRNEYIRAVKRSLPLPEMITLLLRPYCVPSLF